MSSRVQTPAGASPRRLSLAILSVMAGLSAVLVRAILSGGQALRGVLLAGVAMCLSLPFLSSLEAGLRALTLFEPLRGLVRRAQYIFISYESADPIHLLSPLVTALAFVMLLSLRRQQLFTATPLARWVTVLAVIYVVQIFNPLQGGVAIGLAGALFFLVPVAWFYFGQEVKLDFVRRTLRWMVGIGLVTSLYGGYQMAFGYPEFEAYWIEHTELYDSIAVGAVKRALATFSSAEEWGRYVQIAAIVAFGFGATARTAAERWAWRACGAGLVAVLLLTGQRTSIFGLLFGLFVLILYGARSWRGALKRGLLIVVPALLLGVLLKPPTEDDMKGLDETQASAALVSHSMRGTLRPTQEGSWQERVKTWTYLATQVVPYRPLGLGLGATSLGAAKFGGDKLPPVEGYLLGLIVTCGLPTAVFCAWIIWRAAAISGRFWVAASAGTPEAEVWRVLAALMPVFILNNIFGSTFTLYSLAPVGWMLIGWVSAEAGRATSAQAVPPTPGQG